MAVVTGGAPTASADVQGFGIYPAGQAYYAGTGYRMFATTADGAGMRWVSFYDNSQCIGSSRTYVVPDALVDVPTAQMY
ncbi:hypothetical protein [Nocardia niigatensis]|uniref:hypothetical protein n=1 Tax=Nocardia niigatensis TaxID=209249 RepID=UPI0005954FAA|nr:hypothetical protein [Nocardia niigatensis]